MKNSNCGSQLNGDEQAIYSFINEYEHSGWVPGYYGIACYYEDIDTVVIQFVNTTGEEMELVSNSRLQAYCPDTAWGNKYGWGKHLNSSDKFRLTGLSPDLAAGVGGVCILT